MDKISSKLGLKSVGEWQKVGITKISRKGGNSILDFYSNNLQTLFTTLYPENTWRFQKLQPKLYFKSLENQREFCNELYQHYNLKCFQDWKKLSRKKVKQQEGGHFLLKMYENSLRKLLQAVYPNYPWERIHLMNDKNLCGNERLSMTLLKVYNNLRLCNLEDWLHVSTKEIMLNGGELLFNRYTSMKREKKSEMGNTSQKANSKYITKRLQIREMVMKEYPNFPWKEVMVCVDYSDQNVQRMTMEVAFNKLKLKTLDDLLKVKRSKLIKQRGVKALLREEYNNDIQRCVLTLYSNYPWRRFYLYETLTKDYFLNIQNQTKYMNYLYEKLKMRSLNQWLITPRSAFVANGGTNLLKMYNNDMKCLLSAVYPHHKFSFSQLKFQHSIRRSGGDTQTAMREKIRFLQRKYMITQKKEWYRLNTRSDNIDIYSILNSFYPSEGWRRSDFMFRAKKVKQRLLYVKLQQLYPEHIMIENYRHPKTLQYYYHQGEYQYIIERGNLAKIMIPFEFDIFIPALNFAFEYQGQQHYEDILSGFNQSNLYQNHDITKQIFARNEKMTLLPVPYWWDESSSSLLTSLREVMFAPFAALNNKHDVMIIRSTDI